MFGLAFPRFQRSTLSHWLRLRAQSRDPRVENIVSKIRFDSLHLLVNARKQALAVGAPTYTLRCTSAGSFMSFVKYSSAPSTSPQSTVEHG